MDSSRYKAQRAIQTRRQTVDGFARGQFQPAMPTAPLASTVQKQSLRDTKFYFSR